MVESIFGTCSCIQELIASAQIFMLVVIQLAVVKGGRHTHPQFPASTAVVSTTLSLLCPSCGELEYNLAPVVPLLGQILRLPAEQPGGDQGRVQRG